MATPLYTCTVYRNTNRRYLGANDPRHGSSGRNIATVKAVRQRSHAGNWFACVQDFMTPDRDAIRAALPHYWRKAFDRATVWHTADSLRANCTLYDVRGRVLASIYCDGYEFTA